MCCDRIALPSFFTGVIQLIDVIEHMCILILHSVEVVRSEINDFRAIDDGISLIVRVYVNPHVRRLHLHKGSQSVLFMPTL